MNAFFLCIVLFIIIYNISHIGSKKSRKRVCYLMFFFFFFLHCFKNNEIYPDIIPYEEMFDRLSRETTLKEALSGPALFEPIWTIITYGFSRILPSSELYFHCISLGICAGYAIFCYRYSKNILFSFMMIMLYPSLMNQSFYVLRQHLASVVLLYSLPYIQHQNMRKYFLCVFVAFFIHYSAIIMLPLYFLFKMLYSKRRNVNVLLFIFIPFAFRYALSFLSYDRYVSYVDNSDSNLLPFIYSASILFLLIMIRKKEKYIFERSEEEITEWFLYKAYIIYSFMISVACIGSSLGRLSNYFVAFYICAIPYFAQYFAKSSRILIYIMYLMLCFILLYFAFGSGYTIFDYNINLS